MTSPRFELLAFTRASAADDARGLLGFLRCRYGLVLLDGIAVRRTADGRIVLSFPEKRDRGGRAYPIVRPADRAARSAIERQVLQGLPGSPGSRP